jgi:hypothetical protein
MKKILLILLCLLVIWDTSFAIDYDIDSYLQWSKLVNPMWDATVEGNFKAIILKWVINIWGFLGLIAVWAIAFGSLKMALSAWEEEKLKKAKEIIKWAIFGFLWVVLASSIVTIIIEFMYYY